MSALGDTVRITAGEFSGCAGQVTQLEESTATVRLSHSQGVRLAWPRSVRVELQDLQRVAA